jgi:hypothetical protein
MKPKIKDYKIVLQAEQFLTHSKSKSARKLIDYNIDQTFAKEFGEDYDYWYQINFLLKPKIVTESIKATTTITFKAKITPLPQHLELLERLEIGL